MSERLFKEVRYDLGTLVSYIEMGEIGLPDIQRPFVWNDSKVRDLFDSMYRGYPIGYLLFWQNSFVEDARQIGAEEKQKPARLLIVDGQQRLTSLFAVIKGVNIIRDNYQKENIEISFSPITERFAVSDAAIRRDKSYIPNISVVWNRATDIFELADKYIQNNQVADKLSPDDIKKIRQSLTTLSNLLNYPFTALELSTSITEEQVAEVFVRINSQGKTLNQSDFILTLMSVFWDEGRSNLEEFCRSGKSPSASSASPYNLISHPDPDQLLRVSVGLGFKRAVLHHVYSILRGKDLETGEFSKKRRIEQFEVLKKAQEQVLNLAFWHDFLKAIALSGYLNRDYISSQTGLMFSYTLYLLGRTEYKVEEFQLRQIIAQWFFMTSLTGRFSGSSESIMESDLARLRNVTTDKEFIRELESVCNEVFTDDYWSINLPSNLATSSARSPSMFAYYASLVLLEADALFSKQKFAYFIDSPSKSTRAPIERHHLFPKSFLAKKGITDLRETNQIANFAVVEWNDNSKISDSDPKKYVPAITSRLAPHEIKKMYYWHALPDNWEEMDYRDFLMRRRERIAQVIADAYHKLKTGEGKNDNIPQAPLEDIVGKGESDNVEFKATLRTNLHTGLPDSKVELSVLKTIAGFLNCKGGKLLIGVSDDKEALGLNSDDFENEDKLHLHLVNLLNSKIGSNWSLYAHPMFEEYEGRRILIIDCSPARQPVYVKDGEAQRFYVRAGNSTSELQGQAAQDYIKLRFRS